MDDFGVLVQNFGIKPQGKSAPMASSKASTTQNYTNVNVDPSFGAKSYSSNPISGTGSFLDDQNDDIFGLNSSNKGYNNYASSNVFDDVFHIPTNNTSSTSRGGGGGGGGGFDFDVESMFKGSMNLNKSNSNSDVGDDLIWGFTEKKSSNVVFGTDDLLSSDPVDDFLGKLGKLGSDQRGSKGVNSIQNEVHTDELIPGFGRTNAANNRAQAASTEKSSGLSSLEELEDFATGRTNKVAKGHVNNISIKKEVKKPVSNRSMEANFIDIEGSLVGDRVQADLPEKTSGLSSLEEFEDFTTSKTSKIPKGRVNGIPTKKEVKKTVSNKTKEANFIDIEGSFSGDYVDSNEAGKMGEPLFPAEGPDLDNFFKPYSKKSVPVTEDTFMNTKSDGVSDLFPETKFKKENKVSPKDLPDAFSSIFEAAPVSGEFEEREGESDERRRIRYESYLRAKARMGEALANLNEREYQAQQERDERHRIAESMETEMKRWAAGKEGNLRALLSSLEQVLAPELGWRPVTLTDLITSSQVKVAYKRAALCVHPDKVQQKGASLQQKYVAEKAFDLLKEAWNKFNMEELR